MSYRIQKRFKFPSHFKGEMTWTCWFNLYQHRNIDNKKSAEAILKEVKTADKEIDKKTKTESEYRIVENSKEEEKAFTFTR